MKGTNTLTLIAIAAAALKIVERYNHIMDEKNISNTSMSYLGLSIVGSLFWLYTQVREGDTIGASFASMSIALELYVLSILVQREIRFNHTQSYELT